MFKKSLIAAGLFAATTTASALPYGYFEARSVGMGNVSVATGSVTTAALSNPAMLSINEQDDTFALLFPAIGVQAIDNGGVIDLVDEYNELENQALTQQTADRFAEISSELSGSSLVANGNVNAALVFAGDTFSYAITYRGTGQVSAGYVETTAADTTPPTFVAPDGVVTALGYVSQELGFSISTKFSIAGMDVAVGVTPKTVQVDSAVYQNLLSNTDADNLLDDAIESDMGSFTTVDAGIAINLMDSFTIGLVAKNLIEESVTDGVNTFDFDTHMRAGVSYHNDFITIAADMDLTEIDPVDKNISLANATSNDSASKMMAVGVELNALDFMQIRAGYQTNTASGSNDPDLISAGVGFWLGFHLDVAVVAGDDDSLGAFVQTGFRF